MPRRRLRPGADRRRRCRCVERTRVDDVGQRASACAGVCHAPARARRRRPGARGERGGTGARARDLQILGDQRGMKIRVHGDYHLGQTLRTERRIRRSRLEGDRGGPPPKRAASSAARWTCRDAPLARLRGASDAAASGPAVEAGERWSDARPRRSSTAIARRRRVRPFRCCRLSPAAFARVLAAFELDKGAVRSALRARHRPAWRPSRCAASAAARPRAARVVSAWILRATRLLGIVVLLGVSGCAGSQGDGAGDARVQVRAHPRQRRTAAALPARVRDAASRRARSKGEAMPWTSDDQHQFYVINLEGRSPVSTS